MLARTRKREETYFSRNRQARNSQLVAAGKKKPPTFRLKVNNHFDWLRIYQFLSFENRQDKRATSFRE